ncbi:MAG TPA: hypothetical protein VGG34_01305 [Opitutaceae bacterium]|jgi:hypothetical protein
MNEQVEFLEMAGAPVTEEEIDKICRFLVGRGWVKREFIAQENRLHIRRLAAIAEASDGRIMRSPGSPGYKLLSSSCEIAEVDACASRWESAGKKYLQQGLALRRRYHRYTRLAPQPTDQPTLSL